MFKVTIYNNKECNCVGFKAYDHAGHGEAGADIVCAAVSILLMNTVNAIERFTKDKFSFSADEVEARMEFSLEGNPSKDTQLLLNTMIQGLTSIEDEEAYTEYIDIIFEEV